jgi:excisionase family DNA binding protein
MTPSFEALWTADDVAAYLKVSRSWVYQHAASGDLPCLHVGGLRRFDPAAVRARVRADSGGVVLPLRRGVPGPA